MAKQKEGLLQGDSTTIWNNGGSRATSVPRAVRELLGVDVRDKLYWLRVGIETVLVRRLDPRRGELSESYRRRLESQEWSIRVAAVGQMTFPRGGEDPESCSLCGEGRVIEVVVPLAVCRECSEAVTAVRSLPEPVEQVELGIDSDNERVERGESGGGGEGNGVGAVG